MKNHHLKSILKDELGHHVLPAICHTRWDTASRTCFRLVCADSVHCQGCPMCARLIHGHFPGGKQGDFSWGWPWLKGCRRGISDLLQPWAVPWVQPLHQEESGLVHHNPGLPALPFKFLGSLRASLMLLHPSPNWAESLVHVHFKEETGIAELIVLCLPTSGLLLLHVQDTQSQVQIGAGSAHHGHSTRITAHICGALHTLWPDAHPQQWWGFPLPCGDHWARERVGAHQVSGLHPSGSQEEAAHCPRPKQRELVHHENHGHRAGHHPRWLLHPHACHSGVFIALPLWASVWLLPSNAVFQHCSLTFAGQSWQIWISGCPLRPDCPLLSQWHGQHALSGSCPHPTPSRCNHSPSKTYSSPRGCMQSASWPEPA